MKNENATLLLVDDHALILQGLRRIIERMPKISCVHTAQSGIEASKLICSGKYDIYVLDVELPDIDGFELIQLIRQKDKDAHIVINTMHEEVWIIQRLIKSGVNSIVMKSSDVNEVQNAILYAFEGKPYFCPRFEAVRRKARSGTGNGSHEDAPTPRELEVLIAIATGDNTAEIAGKMNVTVNTVETFRKRLMLKFNARNAVDLVVKAMEKGFIPIHSKD